MTPEQQRRVFELGRKAGATGNYPPHYIAVIDSIVQAYNGGASLYPKGEEPHRFRFPERVPPCSLDDPGVIDRIACNTGARVFLESLVGIATALASVLGDFRAMPTVLMTRVAMEVVGAEIELVPLEKWTTG